MLPPVALSEWPFVEPDSATHFTSVMRWQGFASVTVNGQVCGEKDAEFQQYIDLPRLTKQPLRLALNGPDFLVKHGWEVVPGEIATRTFSSYRDFIQQSRGEFGVARQYYVKTRGGWFSDRSVCYLASGRPVLVQDTALSDWLPTGEGVLTFRNVAEAVSGLEQVNSDYQRHRQAARRLAEEYFSAAKVLPPLLETAMQ